MAEIEIELKLRIDPAAIERFRRDPAIHRAKRGRARSIALRAVYFDTPDLDFRQMKSALRIRQEGANRVQTLKIKARDGNTGGLQRRLEFNAPIQASVPDLSLIEDPEVLAVLEPFAASDGLVEVFATDVRRTAWLLDLPDGTVELALDIGRIESRGSSTDICEVELELKGGQSSAILDFADFLINRFGCSISDETKAARGYALFQGIAASPQKAEKLRLDGDDSAWTSLVSIINAGTVQLFGNDATVLEGGAITSDIEGVHQARVALRRIRAALSAFDEIIPDEVKSRLNTALRRHQRLLGAARDWDVFIDETLTPVRALPDAPKALDRFSKRCAAARILAYKKVHREMRNARYGRLQLELIRFSTLAPPGVATDRTTAELAGKLLQLRYDEVEEIAGTAPSHLEEVRLHELRIKIKNLRYTIDCFINIYPKNQIKPWRSAAKALQDCLGGLNDSVVHAELLDRMHAPDMPVPKSVRRAITAWNEARIEKGMHDLDASWDRFVALDKYWQVEN